MKSATISSSASNGFTLYVCKCFCCSKITALTLIRAYHTYGGQGTKKSNIEPGDHAIIYSDSSRPALLQKEPKLSKDPIRVIGARKPLHRASRINFGKVYTIEHNRLLMPVGAIDPQHINKLKTYWIQCISE